MNQKEYLHIIRTNDLGGELRKITKNPDVHIAQEFGLYGGLVDTITFYNEIPDSDEKEILIRILFKYDYYWGYDIATTYINPSVYESIVNIYDAELIEDEEIVSKQLYAYHEKYQQAYDADLKLLSFLNNKKNDVTVRRKLLNQEIHEALREQLCGKLSLRQLKFAYGTITNDLKVLTNRFFELGQSQNVRFDAMADYIREEIDGIILRELKAELNAALRILGQNIKRLISLSGLATNRLLKPILLACNSPPILSTIIII